MEPNSTISLSPSPSLSPSSGPSPIPPLPPDHGSLLLSPNPEAVTHVITALSALHSGVNASAADFFLRSHIQPSPTLALPVASAIFASPSSAALSSALSATPNRATVLPAAQLFAATALDEHAHHAPYPVAALALAALARDSPLLPAAAASRLASAAALPAASAALTGVSSTFRAALDDAHRSLARWPARRCVFDHAVAARIRVALKQWHIGHSLGPGAATHAALVEATTRCCEGEAERILRHAAEVLLRPRDERRVSGGVATMPAASDLIEPSVAVPVENRAHADAVSCIRGWTPYACDVVRLVLEPLFEAMRAETLPTAVVSDIGFAVADAVDLLPSRVATELQPVVLRKLFSALRRIFSAHVASSAVRHATAEICVSLADTCADVLVEAAAAGGMDAQDAVVEAVGLMALCVQCADHRTFEAALMAWDVWIASASVGDQAAVSLISSSLPALVRAIVAHLQAVGERRPSVTTVPGVNSPRAPVRHEGFGGNDSRGESMSGVDSSTGPGDYPRVFAAPSEIPENTIINGTAAPSSVDECHEKPTESYDHEATSVHLRNVAGDTLHQAAQLMTVAQYVNVLLEFLHEEAALFALGAAGDVACGERDIAAVASLLPRIVSLTLPNQASCPAALRRSAIRALASFAHVLVSADVDDKWLSTALTSACAALFELGEEPALLLKEVAETRASRLVPFLHILIEAVQDAVGSMVELDERGRPRYPVNSEYLEVGSASDSRSAGCQSTGEMVVHGLALVAAELPRKAMREDALQRIIIRPVGRLRTLAGSVGATQNPLAPALVSRDLRLIGVAVRHINDSQIAVSLLESLWQMLPSLTARFANDHQVAPALCHLLEVCATPTLRDPGDVSHRSVEDSTSERVSRSPTDHYRIVVSCISLSSEAFARSGPRGDPSWVKSMAELALQVLPAPPVVAESCLVTAVERALWGLSHFASSGNGGLQARPELTASFLSLILVLVENADDVGAHRAGLSAVRASAEACGEAACASLSVDDVAVLQPALQWWSRVLRLGNAGDLANRALSRIGDAQGLCDSTLRTLGLSRTTRRCAFLVAEVIIALSKFVGAGARLVLNLEPILRDGNDANKRAGVYHSVLASFESGNVREFGNALSGLRIAKEGRSFF